VPQYILDSFIDRNAGACCNIVVTQVLHCSAVNTWIRCWLCCLFAVHCWSSYHV